MATTGIWKIENRIDKLEARISEIETDMLKPDVSSDISKLLPLSNEKEVICLKTRQFIHCHNS